eukprot:CAMPEP_0185843952 /NCGR_PEP_ID=MMETSP1354-20130828/298_1 /TAXON_ID=708628 /ORGANISM="Erythrolobus madagascarensis, Strain CCMP3276" /LENGTH=724 /DNA_ID=CAMNT_0028543547 /DNA_START=65 /DNA_END=2239 /DNA_ORIENTATION=+
MSNVKRLSARWEGAVAENTAPQPSTSPIKDEKKSAGPSESEIGAKRLLEMEKTDSPVSSKTAPARTTASSGSSGSAMKPPASASKTVPQKAVEESSSSAVSEPPIVEQAATKNAAVRTTPDTQSSPAAPAENGAIPRAAEGMEQDVSASPAPTEVVDLVATFATGKTGSSRALEVAIGVPLCAALLLVIQANLMLFSSMLMGVLVAALLSVAMMPLRDVMLQVLFPKKSGSQGSESGGDEDKEIELLVAQNAEMARSIVFVAPRKVTLGLFALVFAALLILEHERAGMLVAFLCAVGSLMALQWAFFRLLVAVGGMSRDLAAAAMSLCAVLTVGGVVLLTFSIGATVDAANAAMTAGTWLKETASDMAGSEWLESNLEMVQTQALQVAGNNRKLVDEYAVKLSDATGIDVSTTVNAVLSGGSGEGNGTDIGQVLQEKFGSVMKTVKSKIPQDKDAAMALVESAKEKMSGAGVDLSEYQDQAVGFLSSVVSFMADIAGSVGEIAGTFSDAVSLMLALFFLLSSGTSSLRYVTKLLPFPTTRFNLQIEKDLRMALTAVMWGVLRFFCLHALYVWMAFSALSLEFESFAALACGIASAVPFLPDPMVVSLIFAAPQLIARKLWIGLVLLPVGHKLIAADAESYYSGIAAQMLVATAVLNRDMLAASSVFGAARFGPPGFFLGPILVTCFSVVYAVFKFVIRQQQDAREKMNPSSVFDVSSELKSSDL